MTKVVWDGPVTIMAMIIMNIVLMVITTYYHVDVTIIMTQVVWDFGLDLDGCGDDDHEVDDDQDV